MDTGWSIDHVLQMPAIRFFAIKKAHNKISQERLGRFFFELCDIVALAPQSNESLQKIKGVYSAMFTDEKVLEKRKNPRVFDSADQKDRDQVAAVLSGFARYMR